MEANIDIVILLLAFVLDKLLGDPLWLPHPIVLMGKIIGWFEKKLNRGTHRQLKGLLTVVLLVVLCYCFFAVTNHLLLQASVWAYAVCNIFFCFTALAGTTLVRECRKVFVCLDNSLESGRKQVGFLVGRDTSVLTEQQVRTATLETLAENLSDGVIAPLFWFAVGGMPAMLTYKIINTLDSMIAYKTEKYLKFGRAAAILDDIANYLPARITAVLMVIVAGSSRAWRFITKYGRAHSSPNAGFPEAALAGILDVQFGGGHCYHGEWIEKPAIGDNNRNIKATDLELSISVNNQAELAMVLVIVLILSIG